MIQLAERTTPARRNDILAVETFRYEELIGMNSMPTYMGDPSKAGAEAGERMLEVHVAEAIAMLEEVRAGKPPFNEPLLWDLRFIERSW